MSDGRRRQKDSQEEAREPEPGPGPGYRPLLPVSYVCPQGHVQEEEQDHWDQGKGRYVTPCKIDDKTIHFTCIDDNLLFVSGGEKD